MARQRQSAFEDLSEIAARFPWWAGVVLALVVYIGLHHVASMEIAQPQGLKSLGEFGGQAVYKTLATFGQYTVPLAFLFGAVTSAFGRWKRGDLFNRVAKQPVKESLEGMTWGEFEMLVGEAFRRQGYTVSERGGRGPDGGVDLVLIREGQKSLVQCKQWKAYKVGVTTIRELYGVMAAEGAVSGYVVTSGVFTQDAKTFAKDKAIELIDGERLRAMIGGMQRVSPPVGGYATSDIGTTASPSNANPLCPQCGGSMVQRTAKQGNKAGNKFWGCQTYPRCRGIRPLN